MERFANTVVLIILQKSHGTPETYTVLYVNYILIKLGKNHSLGGLNIRNLFSLLWRLEIQNQAYGLIELFLSLRIWRKDNGDTEIFLFI